MQGVSRIEGYRRRWREPEAPQLTFREDQILRLVAQGKGNQEISECLGISPLTVKVHLTHIFEKLGVNRRMEAVMMISSQP